jgi:hypothetical protein
VGWGKPVKIVEKLSHEPFPGEVVRDHAYLGLSGLRSDSSATAFVFNGGELYGQTGKLEDLSVTILYL